MSGFRRRGRRQKDREDNYNRKMADMRRQEEEHREDRQQRVMAQMSVSDLSSRGRSDFQIANRDKNERVHHEKEMTGFKSSLFETQQQSPRHVKKSGKKSPPSLLDRSIGRNIERKRSFKKLKGSVFDGLNDKVSEENLTLEQKNASHKISSSISKTESGESISPRGLKTTKEDDCDNISSNGSNRSPTYSYVSTRCRDQKIRYKRSNFQEGNSAKSDHANSYARGKLSFVAQPTTIQTGRSDLMKNTGTIATDLQSDSDGSFDILTLHKQKEKIKIQADEIRNTKIKRSDYSCSSGPGVPFSEDCSISKSEDVEKINLKGCDEKSRLRKKEENVKIFRKRHACNSDCSEGREDRNPKRRCISSSSGKIKTISRDNDRNRFHDKADLVGTNDTQKVIPKRDRINNQPCGKDGNSAVIPGEIGNEHPKTAAVTFADDDDGFMSDCDPISASSPVMSVKGDKSYISRKARSSAEDLCTMFRRKRKKMERNTQNNERGNKSLLTFTNDVVQYEEDEDGRLDDLHPNFKSPKFGPYEPMEPLTLSNDQNWPEALESSFDDSRTNNKNEAPKLLPNKSFHE